MQTLKLTIMKNVIFLILATVAMTGWCDAQELKLGLGLAATDFSKIDGGDSKGKVGGQFGGSIVFGDKFYFEPGIYYVTKSTELTFDSSGDLIDNGNTDAAASAGFTKSVRLPIASNATLTDEDVEAKIKGIRVPVAVGLGVLGNNESLANVRVFGGASGFFVTGTSDDIDKDSIEKTSWGVFAGAGVDVWILFLDLSYEWSLTDVSKDVQAIDVGKQRSFYANAGIRLKF